jgi:hypothetical protein
LKRAKYIFPSGFIAPNFLPKKSEVRSSQ